LWHKLPESTELCPRAGRKKIQKVGPIHKSSKICIKMRKMGEITNNGPSLFQEALNPQKYSAPIKLRKH